MTKAFTILSLLFTLSLIAVCQDNIITGSDIPDATAQFLYFQSLNSLPANLLNDNLTNSVRIGGSDLDAVVAALDDFKSKNSAAIESYHHAVGVTRVDDRTFAATADAVNGNSVAFSSLASAQSVLTVDTLTTLRANMSPIGFATLMKAIQAQKVNMKVSAPHLMVHPDTDGGGQGQGCNGMSPNYSTVETATPSLISSNPVHATGTITWTLSGSAQVSGTNCNQVYHTGNINLSIGGQAATNGQKGPANAYFNFSAHVTLDNTVESCLDAAGCDDNSGDSMYCSFLAANIYLLTLSEKIELAWSQSVWPGAPPVSPPRMF